MRMICAVGEPAIIPQSRMKLGRISPKRLLDFYKNHDTMTLMAVVLAARGRRCMLRHGRRLREAALLDLAHEPVDLLIGKRWRLRLRSRTRLQSQSLPRRVGSFT